MVNTIIENMKRICSLFFSVKRNKAATSVTVIGGADGPTSVFLAGKIPDRSVTVAVAAGIILVLLIIFFIWRRRHKSKES